VESGRNLKIDPATGAREVQSAEATRFFQFQKSTQKQVNCNRKIGRIELCRIELADLGLKFPLVKSILAGVKERAVKSAEASNRKIGDWKKLEILVQNQSL